MLNYLYNYTSDLSASKQRDLEIDMTNYSPGTINSCLAKLIREQVIILQLMNIRPFYHLSITLQSFTASKIWSHSCHDVCHCQAHWVVLRLYGVIFDGSYTCTRVQARLLCPCAKGAILVTLSHPNCLNSPDGYINIALGAHRLSQHALVKSNLTLIYTNIYFYCSDMCPVAQIVESASYED